MAAYKIAKELDALGPEFGEDETVSRDSRRFLSAMKKDLAEFPNSFAGAQHRQLLAPGGNSAWRRRVSSAQYFLGASHGPKLIVNFLACGSCAISISNFIPPSSAVPC